ncbi:MAG: Transcriptional regulator, GntR family [candidate division TA06 bacterium 34_109]|uniref:Transcriptional regulator, GntR family n=1 Tax=candidate division TA06 bacterium 34_109 TaxID=1635277 RepID=A0A101HZZ8_UNCT6|nr:MAG: Transcriptional regulator, GntR family [candidate division TA06 bacterium 34_109]
MAKNDSFDNFLKQNSAIDLSVKTATSDKVYSILSKAIFQGDLKPGQRLVESKLAKLMKVSRTPVREAIIELEQKGLVVSSPPKGVRVAPLPTKEALNEFYDISSVLRGLAVRKAIDNNNITPKDIRQLNEILSESERFLTEGSLRKIADLNIKFHSTIEQCSKSKELIIILDNLYKKSRERFSEIISKADRQKKSIEEHKMIVEAIIKKDSVLAEKLMREHIVNGKEALIQEIELRENCSTK